VIEPDVLHATLERYLPRQRWFGGNEGDAKALEIVSTTTLQEPWPALVQVLLQVPDPAGTSTYHVVLGLRPFDSHDAFLEGKADAILGEVPTEHGAAIAYDATVDAELALCLLQRAAPTESASRARPLGADQSNTSIVFDERIVMKVFRRISMGANPDVEVTTALADRGFSAVPRPIAQWEGGGGHLAVVTEFLTGGSDGFQLALTSVRDLYDARCAPTEAGGDFGPDACRLGGITAEMHVALADAFGVSPGEPKLWVEDMLAQLARTVHADLPVKAVRDIESSLLSIDVGPAIRIHGDFHLGQVMRSDAGWFVLDFEGEPARPVEERRRPSSALRDVAGMLRSFHYAAEVGLREYGHEADAELRELAAAWEAHNRARFLEGYHTMTGIDRVLPASERDLVLAAFELDKAVYEVGYEASYRPEWVGIPLSAVQRILEESPRDHPTA
jgi:maltokinase